MRIVIGSVTTISAISRGWDASVAFFNCSLVAFNATVAAFLTGMGKYAYYGRGGGWGATGESACASWLQWMPEYDRPLGEPTAVAAEPSPGVYTRAFATGTRVFLNTTKGGGHCVWWSDGATTGDEATCAAGPR